MSGVPHQVTPGVIENVQLSGDERTLLVAITDTDPEVVAFAKAGGLGEDPVASTKAYLRLGILAGSVGPYQATIGDIVRVSRQMEALRLVPQQVAGELSAVIGTQLARVVGDDERPSAISAALDAVTAEAATRLSEIIVPLTERLVGADPQALPQLLEARLSETLTREARVVLNRMFATDGSSPLMVHLANGTRAIEALQTDNAALEARLNEKLGELTTHVIIQQANSPTPIDSGRGWEANTLDDLSLVTALVGDTVEFTGDTPAHGGAKSGDHVLHVAEDNVDGIRVAIECRGGTTRRMTVAALRAAVANRDAHAGLLLSEHAGTLPRDAEACGFRVYWGERLVVLHHDRADPSAGQMLAVAVQVARTFAKMGASSTESIAERQQLRVACGRIESALTHLRPLRAAVTGIEKETGAVQKHASVLEAEIRRALADLAALAETAA